MRCLFYRILSGLGLLAGLAACSRASYPALPQAAYQPAPAPASAAAPATRLVLPAISVVGRPTPSGHAAHRPRQTDRRFAYPAALAPPLASTRPPRPAPQRRFQRQRRETARQAGSYGPYFDSGFGWAIVLLGLFYALLVGLLFYLAGKLLGKLLAAIRNRPRRAQALPLPPAGP